MSACGTYSSYTSGCRCLACREACRIYHAGYRRRQGVKVREEVVLVHGRSMYNRYRCRCEICVEANRAYLRQWRQRREMT